MIKQAEWIKDWCDEKGFNFVQTKKVPCSLDKNYKADDLTFFISGFEVGSKRISLSYGGLKQVLNLKVPVEQLTKDSFEKHLIPRGYNCPKCKKNNLNLRTRDDHKTYICPACYNAEEAKMRC